MSRLSRFMSLSCAAALALAVWCRSAGAFPAAEGFGPAAMQAELRSRSGAVAPLRKTPVTPAASPLSALLFVATEAEFNWIAGQLGKSKTSVVNGVEVTTGMLSGRRVAVVETGIGKDEALASAAAVLKQLKPRAVLSTGVAGALSSEVTPGDVVIAGSCGFHSVDRSGAKRSAPGFTAADSGLVARARVLVSEVAQAGTRSAGRKVILGRVTTGDEAVVSESEAANIHSTRRSVAADSEAAYLAGLCAGKKVPFLAIRGISHRAGKNGAAEFARFGDAAAEASARVAAALIQ